METKKGFTIKKICGETVLSPTGMANINFTKLIRLNETAAFLWEEASKGPFEESSLVKALTAKYNVDEERAAADVAALVVKWRETGLLAD